jgi:NADPH-dependent ferric siderophore reductase
VYEREPDDRRLDLIETQFSGLAAKGAQFVLTGKAGSIQRLRQALRVLAVPSSRIHAKVYWAPGKTGLD